MSPYFRLMRLHQPVGIWLLFWPCAWSIALASEGRLPWLTLALFALGAVLMRSAGCVINDMTDHNLDAQVERTKTRPLASGELSMRQAFGLLVLLLMAALGVAILLGKIVVMWAALALVPVVIYPFMKRIIWWPQLFLGLTFNWGTLMGWAAVRGAIDWPALALYAGSASWTLGYDTIYAHQDKHDDARIGIKSTALRLGAHTKPAVAVFYALALIGWAMATPFGWNWLFLALTAAHFAWQIKSVNLEDPASCRRVFISNSRLGWLILLGFLTKS